MQCEHAPRKQKFVLNCFILIFALLPWSGTKLTISPCSTCIYLFANGQLLQYDLLKRLPFLHPVAFAPLFKKKNQTKLFPVYMWACFYFVPLIYLSVLAPNHTFWVTELCNKSWNQAVLPFQLCSCFFFFFFWSFCLCRAASEAHGSSQARGPIGAVAATAVWNLSRVCDLHHSSQQHGMLN